MCNTVKEVTVEEKINKEVRSKCTESRYCFNVYIMRTGRKLNEGAKNGIKLQSEKNYDAPEFILRRPTSRKLRTTGASSSSNKQNSVNWQININTNKTKFLIREKRSTQ